LLHLAECLRVFLVVHVHLQLVKEVSFESSDFDTNFLFLLVVVDYLDAAFVEAPVTDAQFGCVL
jgi:hypothetical protein